MQSFGKVLIYIFDVNNTHTHIIYIYIYVCIYIYIYVAQGVEALNSVVMGNRKNVIF